MIVAMHPQQADVSARHNYHKGIRNFINTKNLQRLRLDEATRIASPIVVNYMCGADFNSLLSKEEGQKNNVSNEVSIIVQEHSNSLTNYIDWNTGTSTNISHKGTKVVLGKTITPIDGFQFSTMFRNGLSPTHLGIDLKTVQIKDGEEMGMNAVARAVFEVFQPLYTKEDIDIAQKQELEPKIHLPITSLVSLKLLLKHNKDVDKLPIDKELKTILTKQNQELLWQRTKDKVDKLAVSITKSQSAITIPNFGKFSPLSYKDAIEQIASMPQETLKKLLQLAEVMHSIDAMYKQSDTMTQTVRYYDSS